jgi:hypothetical protein
MMQSKDDVVPFGQCVSFICTVVQRRICRMMSSLSLSSPLRCSRSCSGIGLLCV